MVTADHDGSFNLFGLYEIVHSIGKQSAFAISEPANARGKTLESYFFASQANPSVEDLIFREEFKYEIVRELDIAWISRERSPSEWAASFGKHGADVGRNESWKVVGVFNSTFISHGPNVVAVVERDGAALLHIEHRLNV